MYQTRCIDTDKQVFNIDEHMPFHGVVEEKGTGVSEILKVYMIIIIRASEGTLSRWSRLHLQSLAPTPVSRRVDVRQAAGRKNNCRIFITT
jgi:hypothetical protein